MYRYAECVDAGDFAGVAELFANGRMIAPDGTVLAEGYDGMLTFYNNTLRLYPDSNTPLTQHVISNLTIGIDEGKNRASGRCCYTVFQKADHFPLQPIIAGRYHDVFERSDGRWRFSERKTLPRLVGDLSKHLLQYTEI